MAAKPHHTPLTDPTHLTSEHQKMIELAKQARRQAQDARRDKPVSFRKTVGKVG
ncbi:hypothetical protein Cci01nite_81450 [Catellatospora citrea]|uniref:Uncharacterized protein n=1 Tax=Catellatospora citrea TaxID=53366 RepID=A0A8J3KNF7_9ACTN|nr:hypothetical protein Cci01nite_81450 [Catellatospora citrea]